ncbi:hypothetical protein [Dyella halodurans]
MMAMLAAVTLQGCVGTPTVLDKAQQQSLDSMQLFNKDASPRFTAYVACTSEDESCATVHKIFSEWADQRQVTLHLINADDPMFKGTAASATKAMNKPYRLAIKINPLLVPSFFQFRGGQYPVGGYYPPRVGYKATVYVVDATSGAILQELPVHHEITANPKDTANGYVQRVVDTLLVSLDPTYRPSDK